MLSAIIGLPFLGAVIIGLYPQTNAQIVRWLALIVSASALGLSLGLVTQFDLNTASLQFVEHLSWLDTLGLTYSLGVDGISLPLLVLNTLLVWVSIWSSHCRHRPRLYYSLILVLGGAVSGAFLAQNALLFFIFFEIELIPLYFLIGIWGGPRRGYASIKFLLYTALAGLLLLVAFFGVVWFSGIPNFNYDTMRQHGLPVGQQLILLILILIGVGIKIPIVPFHTWLPDAHVEASTPVSVLLAGILLKLGTYALLRFGVDFLPGAWQVAGPVIASLAVVNVLYGSLNALAQQDMKKLVAYGSVAHMGYVLLATAAATPLSLTGSVGQMISHGLISSLLFLLVGAVYANTGTRDLNQLRGLLNPERGLPLVGSLMILGVMASAGTPGMVGFIAEFVVFRSSFAVFPIQTLLCMLGTALTAAYFLLLVNRVFFGRLSQRAANMPQRTLIEQLPAATLAIIIVILGLQPHWIFRYIETASIHLVETRYTLSCSPKTSPAPMTQAALMTQDQLLT